MPKFYYGDCGHPIGTDGTEAHLKAKRAELRAAQFHDWLRLAIETGEAWDARSSSLLHSDVLSAICAVADNPSAEAIATAHRVYRGEPHSERVVVARGVNFHGGRYRYPNAVIYRIAYWDGTPGLVVDQGAPLEGTGFEATIKFRYHCEQPEPGNVFVQVGGIYDGVYDALRDLGIVGDAIRPSLGAEECPLLA